MMLIFGYSILVLVRNYSKRMKKLMENMIISQNMETS